jgi:hypothetical protein
MTSKAFLRHFPVREGDGCVKDTDHLSRHRRVHPDDPATAQRRRSCAWRDDHFGRGQNTRMGWSDPTFRHLSVAKRPLGSLQPIQSNQAFACTLVADEDSFDCMQGGSRRERRPFYVPSVAVPWSRSRPGTNSTVEVVQSMCKPESLSDTASDNLYEQERRSPLSILKAPPKQPKTVTVQARVEESVKTQLERYAEFIDASPSYVITEALKLLFRKDDDFRRWADQHSNNRNHEQIQGEDLTKTPQQT